MSNCHTKRPWRSAATAALSIALASLSHAQPPEGYQDYQSFSATIREFEASPTTTVSRLGVTAQGRDIFLVTLCEGEADEKPAVLILGSVESNNLVGSELAVKVARRLAGEEHRELLQNVSFYIIPRPSPTRASVFSKRPSTQ